MAEGLLNLVQRINAYLSDYILLTLLAAAGVWLTVRTGFVQVRCFGEGLRCLFGSSKGKGQRGGISSFQALAASIGAQVGTGNIVGAAGAILTGGPGAIFWMWVIAFFGMATAYAEAVLAQKTRVRLPDGTLTGGPVYYIEKAFGGALGKALACFFALAATLVLGFFGAMVQSNSIGAALYDAFGTPKWAVGCALAAVCAVIFLGGVKRLASVTEKLVPFMALLFILGGLAVLTVRRRYLPAALGMIFRYAFSPQAILGGTFGTAIRKTVMTGTKRGLFSNEAGLGSTPHAHALAEGVTPHEQGCVAVVGVFIDTFVILTLSALVIISTLYTPDGALSGGYFGNVTEALTKSNLAQTAFGTVFGEHWGGVFIAVSLFFFAFSSILGWNLFGKMNFIYLFGSKYADVYTLLSLAFVYMGAVAGSDLVWEMSDMLNNMMVIPNVAALFALTELVSKK